MGGQASQAGDERRPGRAEEAEGFGPSARGGRVDTVRDGQEEGAGQSDDLALADGGDATLEQCLAMEAGKTASITANTDSGNLEMKGPEGTLKIGETVQIAYAGQGRELNNDVSAWQDLRDSPTGRSSRLPVIAFTSHQRFGLPSGWTWNRS